MDFSIFSGDGTLGNAYREVTIKGNGTDNTLFGGDDSWFRAEIIAAMSENGIGISDVRVTVGGSVYFEVDVNAIPEHSGSQVRQMVHQAVANKTYSYIPPNVWGPFYTINPQSRRILANISTTVLRDPGQPASPATPSPSGPVAGPSPWSSGYTPAPVTPSGNAASSGIGSGFLTGLGLSTPLLIGGAVLLVLATRRR